MNGTFTAEQLVEMEQAARSRQAAIDNQNPITPQDLPAAPPQEPLVSRPPEEDPGRPLTREELSGYGATPREQDVALNAQDRQAQGVSPAAPGPQNTEDTGEGLTAEQIAHRRAVAANGGREPEDDKRHADEEDAGPSGSPGHLVPGGMDPYTEKRDVKHGKVVAPGVRDAYGQAGRLGMEAAGIDRDANAELFHHERDAAMAKFAAGESAMAQQQRLAEDRDRMVQARLAEIETLNKKAQGNPEDLWSAPHVFGRMAGFLMLTLGTVSMATGGKGGVAPGIAMGMAGKFVDGLINQDIQHKVDERRQASAASGRAINLLHLHEERMNDKKKAIDATKMAYYDNVLQQMEAYKADHAGEVNEANYLNLQKQILESQAETANRLGKQEQADVTDELVNKYRPPAMVGGSGGGAHKEPDFVVTTPNGVSYAMPNKEAQNKYIAGVEEKQRLIRINNEIASLRKEAVKIPVAMGADNYTKRKSLIARIEELEQNKLKGIESAEKQGVLREGEYDRAKALTGHATGGLGMIRGVPIVGPAEQKAADDVIAQQTARWSKDLEEGPHAAAAPIVKRRVAVNPNTKEKEANTIMTGQFSKPMPGMAPRGSESRDRSRPVQTMEEPSSDTTPKAPIVPYPKDLPTPAAHHGRKKKK